MNCGDEVKPETHFVTTTNTTHDNKFPYGDAYNDPVGLRQTLPIPSYKVNYIGDVVEKVVT